MILTKAQAEAVYSAMCALNNVGARIDAFRAGRFHAREISDGRIVINIANNQKGTDEMETYADQAAFAIAYGLNDDDQPRAVYTPGIGWQRATKNGRFGNFDTEAQALAAT